MSEEDKKLQKHLVNEMMKVSETNPDVMFYMEALMKKYEELEQKVEQLEKENKRLKEWKEDLLSENIELENIRKEAKDFIKNNTYEYFHDGNLKDKTLSINKTIFIDNLLNILNKGSE